MTRSVKACVVPLGSALGALVVDAGLGAVTRLAALRLLRVPWAEAGGGALAHRPGATRIEALAPAVVAHLMGGRGVIGGQTSPVDVRRAKEERQRDMKTNR